MGNTLGIESQLLHANDGFWLEIAQNVLGRLLRRFVGGKRFHCDGVGDLPRDLQWANAEPNRLAGGFYRLDYGFLA